MNMRKFTLAHGALILISIIPLVVGSIWEHLFRTTWARTFSPPADFPIIAIGAGMLLLWFATGLLSSKYIRSKLEAWLFLNGFMLLMTIMILIPSFFVGFSQGGSFLGTTPQNFFFSLRLPLMTASLETEHQLQNWLPFIFAAALSVLSFGGILLGKKIFRQYRR